MNGDSLPTADLSLASGGPRCFLNQRAPLAVGPPLITHRLQQFASCRKTLAAGAAAVAASIAAATIAAASIVVSAVDAVACIAAAAGIVAAVVAAGMVAAAGIGAREP